MGYGRLDGGLSILAQPPSQMKHERDFLAEEHDLKPYPAWVRSTIWLLALAFGVGFWWGVVYLALHVFF
jgi:hypothetical protein